MKTSTHPKFGAYNDPQIGDRVSIPRNRTATIIETYGPVWREPEHRSLPTVTVMVKYDTTDEFSPDGEWLINANLLTTV